jgi:hypothetical protein
MQPIQIGSWRSLKEFVKHGDSSCLPISATFSVYSSHCCAFHGQIASHFVAFGRGSAEQQPEKESVPERPLMFETAQFRFGSFSTVSAVIVGWLMSASSP